jgi:hypothetical protein
VREAAGSERGWGVAIAATLALAFAACDRADPPPAPAAPTDRPAPFTVTSPDRPLPPAGTLELTRGKFPADGPVRVSLGLREASADAEPRPVRMFSETDQHGLQTNGTLDETRTVVTIELDPTWLLPGTYFVEVVTTDRNPFPVQRYAIVVR